MDIWLNRQAGVDTAPLLFHGLGTTLCPIEDAIAADPFLLFLGEDPQARRLRFAHLCLVDLPQYTAVRRSQSLTSARVCHVPSHIKRYPTSLPWLGAIRLTFTAFHTDDSGAIGLHGCRRGNCDLSGRATIVIASMHMICACAQHDSSISPRAGCVEPYAAGASDRGISGAVPAVADRHVARPLAQPFPEVDRAGGNPNRRLGRCAAHQLYLP